MNPMEWFVETYCSHCKAKTCMPKGMVYTNDPSAKVLCALSLLLMLETDRGLAKQAKKD
jgi:hypothetical protein